MGTCSVLMSAVLGYTLLYANKHNDHGYGVKFDSVAFGLW